MGRDMGHGLGLSFLHYCYGEQQSALYLANLKMAAVGSILKLKFCANLPNFDNLVAWAPNHGAYIPVRF